MRFLLTLQDRNNLHGEARSASCGTAAMKHVPPRLRPATVVVAVATATATIVCLLMLWMRPHCSPAPLPAPGTAQPSCPANCLAPASGALLPGNASLRSGQRLSQDMTAMAITECAQKQPDTHPAVVKCSQAGVLS